jgi:hypothetical protein
MTDSRVELDGEYIGEYSEDTVNRVRGDARPRPSATTFGAGATGTVLPAGYEDMLLSVDDFDGGLEWHMEFVRLVRDRLSITFRYESLYGGEKLEVKWQRRRVEGSEGGAARDGPA